MFYVIQEGATPLIVASQQGHNDVVELLLDRGAHVNHSMKVHAFLLSKRLANTTLSVGQTVELCDVNS